MKEQDAHAGRDTKRPISCLFLGGFASISGHFWSIIVAVGLFVGISRLCGPFESLCGHFVFLLGHF